MLRRAAGLRIHLDAVWAAERRRVFLWVPVLFGAGSGLYLTLPVEPIGWIAPAAAGLFALGALLLRRHMAPALGLVALALLAAGVAAADWRSDQVSAPVLADSTGPVDVSGRVVWVGAGEGTQRYLLDRVTIEDLAPAETPEKVRLSVRRSDDDLASPGTWLRALASLRPPPAPAEPGAWDFGRQAWFQRIGAVGFVYGAPEPMAAPEGEGGGPLSLLSRVRHWVSSRILADTSPSAGPFATALLTGDRSAIEKSALKAMRDSGLAHLLAISGLHVGLIAGLHLLRYAGPVGADRAARPQSTDQEVGGRLCAAGCGGIPAALRHERPDPAGLRHGGRRAGRDHAGPGEPLDAADRLGRVAGAGDRARKHARAELPDVLRCSDRPDRDLRSGAGHLRPNGGTRRPRAPSRGLRGRRHAHLLGSRHRHRPVRGLPLQPHRGLRPPRQPRRGADHRLLDHALGAGCAHPHAVRARRDCPRPDGLGDRRGGLDRAPGRGATGRGQPWFRQCRQRPCSRSRSADCGFASGAAAGAFSGSS